MFFFPASHIICVITQIQNFLTQQQALKGHYSPPLLNGNLKENKTKKVHKMSTYCGYGAIYVLGRYGMYKLCACESHKYSKPTPT